MLQLHTYATVQIRVPPRLLLLALLSTLAGVPAAAQSVTALYAGQKSASAGLRGPEHVPTVQADTDSTARHYDTRNWERGALIGGIAGGVLGGAFAVGVLCQLTDESCVGQTIGTMFISGAIGAFIGAVLIPATPVSQ